MKTIFDKVIDTLDRTLMAKENAKKETAGNSNNGHENGCWGYRVICNCPHCAGAVFPYNSGRGNKWEEKHLYQCFQCSRIYVKNKESAFELWAKPIPKILRFLE